MKDIEDYSDKELIEIAIDYADENLDFDDDFVRSLEKKLDLYNHLTVGQRKALENVVISFEMI